MDAANGIRARQRQRSDDRYERFGRLLAPAAAVDLRRAGEDDAFP